MLMLIAVNVFIYRKELHSRRVPLKSRTSMSMNRATNTPLGQILPKRVASPPQINALSTTAKLQFQLYKMNFIQIFLLFACLVLPFCTILIFLAINHSNTFSIFLILMSFSCVHGILDNFVILWFVRPYRMFVFRVGSRLVARFNRSVGIFQRRSKRTKNISYKSSINTINTISVGITRMRDKTSV